MSNFLFVIYLSSLFLFYFGNLSLVIMRHKIVIIIKSLCSVILWGQLKIKKTLVLHYSIDRYATYTLPLNSKILMEYSFFFPWKLCSVIKNTSHKMTHAHIEFIYSRYQKKMPPFKILPRSLSSEPTTSRLLITAKYVWVMRNFTKVFVGWCSNLLGFVFSSSFLLVLAQKHTYKLWP